MKNFIPRFYKRRTGLYHRIRKFHRPAEMSISFKKQRAHNGAMCRNHECERFYSVSYSGKDAD